MTELVQVIEGRLQRPRRRWYTLGLALSHRATLDDQLDAIKMLGRTRNPAALEYLNELARQEEEQDSVESGGPFPQETRISGRRWHSRAKGKLGEVLTTSWFSQEWADGITGAWGDHKHPRYWEASIAITTAIDALKQSINPEPS